MISCSQYDYLEIACLYRFPVRLTLISGETIEGVAFDTGYNQARQECLLLNSNTEQLAIPTENLKSLEVTIANPHFTLVEFKQ